MERSAFYTTIWLYRGPVKLDLVQAEDRKIAAVEGNVGRRLPERDKFPPMSARGRLLSGLVSMVIASAGLVTVGALPAAASPSTVQYVALGDSYATGQGAGRSLNSCMQTEKGYPELLDSEKRIHLQANATCSGATTSTVANSQLSALNSGTRLVTLTVGGNDLGVSHVATVCTTGTLEQCQAEIAIVRFSKLPELRSNLVDLYAQVADEAPKARIVVTGYPYLFGPPSPTCNPSVDVLCAINIATTELNRAIQDAVAATKNPDVKIVYVDVSEEFAEHGIGSADPFLNSTGGAAFHPNAAGHRAYAAAIAAALEEQLV